MLGIVNSVCHTGAQRLWHRIVTIILFTCKSYTPSLIPHSIWSRNMTAMARDPWMQTQLILEKHSQMYSFINVVRYQITNNDIIGIFTGKICSNSKSVKLAACLDVLVEVLPLMPLWEGLKRLPLAKYHNGYNLLLVYFSLKFLHLLRNVLFFSVSPLRQSQCSQHHILSKPALRWLDFLTVEFQASSSSALGYRG